MHFTTPLQFKLGVMKKSRFVFDRIYRQTAFPRHEFRCNTAKRPCLDDRRTGESFDNVLKYRLPFDLAIKRSAKLLSQGIIKVIFKPRFPRNRYPPEQSP